MGSSLSGGGWFGPNLMALDNIERERRQGACAQLAKFFAGCPPVYDRLTLDVCQIHSGHSSIAHPRDARAFAGDHSSKLQRRSSDEPPILISSCVHAGCIRSRHVCRLGLRAKRCTGVVPGSHQHRALGRYCRGRNRIDVERLIGFDVSSVSRWASGSNLGGCIGSSTCAAPLCHR